MCGTGNTGPSVPAHASLPSPAPAAATTATAARAAAGEAGAAAAAGRAGDGGADAGVEGGQAAREADRVEAAGAVVPARRGGRCRLDAPEGARPLLHGAEDDRVGQVLGEDVGLFVELLAVGLGGG